jgi:hypothetical protein
MTKILQKPLLGPNQCLKTMCNHVELHKKSKVEALSHGLP